MKVLNIIRSIKPGATYLIVLLSRNSVSFENILDILQPLAEFKVCKIRCIELLGPILAQLYS